MARTLRRPARSGRRPDRLGRANPVRGNAQLRAAGDGEPAGLSHSVRRGIAVDDRGGPLSRRRGELTSAANATLAPFPNRGTATVQIRLARRTVFSHDEARILGALRRMWKWLQKTE